MPDFFPKQESLRATLKEFMADGQVPVHIKKIVTYALEKKVSPKKISEIDRPTLDRIVVGVGQIFYRDDDNASLAALNFLTDWAFYLEDASSEFLPLSEKNYGSWINDLQSDTPSVRLQATRILARVAEFIRPRDFETSSWALYQAKCDFIRKRCAPDLQYLLDEVTKRVFTEASREEKVLNIMSRTESDVDPGVQRWLEEQDLLILEEHDKHRTMLDDIFGSGGIPDDDENPSGPSHSPR